MTIKKTFKVTAIIAVLAFANFFLVSASFSSLTGGSSPFISDAFAQGGKNTANQGISQSNSATQTGQCIGGMINGACNNTSTQSNVNSGGNTAGQTATGGGTGMGTNTQSKYFDAKLAGKNEVPPKDTKATGTANFNVIGTSSLGFNVHVKDIKMVTASHIHQGKIGQNGPVVVVLFNTTNPSATTNNVLAKGTITAKDLVGPMTGKQIKDLINMIKSGDAYVNVHTTANPMGEIRGQLVEGKTGMSSSGSATTGGTNTANQGISQSNSAIQNSQCIGGMINGACNSTTNQGNVNSGGNTAGQTAGGGSGRTQ